jgi:glycosyltransferase involved in cell wall biosynthesis
MERMAVELSNVLDPAEFDVMLCATRAGGPAGDELRDGVPLVVLHRRSRWDVSGISRFGRLVRSREIEVVHSHGRGTAKLVSLCRATGLISSRHVFHDHFGEIEIDDRVEPGLRLAARTGVDRYLGVSRALCEWAVDGLGLRPDRVALVPNGIDLRRFDAEKLGQTQGLPDGLPTAPDAIVAAAVAGFREAKDHPTLLRALASCENRHRVQLVLIGASSGDAYARRCHTMIADLGLSGQVRMLGARTDVPAVLAASDIGVLSSASESGPLALLEYMAAGLPYAVTEAGELGRAVKAAESGFVVPPRSPAALGAAIDRLVSMAPSERRAMGARGRSLVLERYDQRRVAAEVAAVYRSVVRSDR